ncbi:MAG: YdeI/OmpD-associated family protein [Alphaproteobacteria bacterium]|nr:YdeI/OmpD-associated family protein [Alphaproteobacteria bacterium]MBV9371583.1 YdeI/OmpD-associated family protein [Alphaproteobacteria bacterium]MBV9902192.1 YdeI/OmpD-associated family protein [Alphaproteobacteria bacterium]
MPKPDPRIDAYIARQAEFARPILDHLRRVVHAAVPEVEETIKWSMPHFTYRGRLFAGMAAFKAHATFGLWQAGTVLGETGAERDAMGQFGRITSLDHLPPEAELVAILRRAAEVAAEGPKPKPKKAPKPELATPDDLRAALDAEPRAAATFDAFPPGSRREYVEWVVEAKRPETRARRIAQAVEWLAEGKRRNWKYEAC